MELQEYAERIAGSLRSSATCTVLVGDNMNASVLFEAIRKHLPVVGVVSRTGRTLHLGVVTEDVRRFGCNDRINLRTHLEHVRKTAVNEWERVLS